MGFDCNFINPMVANESMFLNVWDQGIAVGHTGVGLIFKHLSRILNLTDPLPMNQKNRLLQLLHYNSRILEKILLYRAMPRLGNCRGRKAEPK
jgi:hypothetical protein